MRRRRRRPHRSVSGRASKRRRTRAARVWMDMARCMNAMCERGQGAHQARRAGVAFGQGKESVVCFHARGAA